MKITKSLILTSILSLSCYSVDHNITHLNYYVPFSGGDARPMQMMVDQFNLQHPDINVKMRVIKWADYYKIFSNSIESGNAPDIGISHASLLKQYVEKNYLTNLSTQNINWDKIPSKLLKAVEFDGNYYAVPLDMHPQVFYFNKKYLSQANLLDENQKLIMKDGIDGFIEFLQKLKNALPRDVVPISTPNLNIYPLWIWYSLYYQQNNSGYIVDNKAAFNNEAGKKALEFLYKMRESKVWSDKIHDEKGYNLFKYNKAATMITGVWATWNFQQNKELDFGVQEFPKLFDKSASFGDSRTLVIPRTTDNQKLKSSALFINWISNNSYEWSLSGQVPANKAVLDYKNFKNLPFRDIYAKSADDMALYPQNSKLKECNDAMRDLLVEFLQSDDSVEETLNRAESMINSILEKN